MMVRHANLKRIDAESPFRSWCPVCDRGLLLVARHFSATHAVNPNEVSGVDRCTLCGQIVIYEDAEIAGHKVALPEILKQKPKDPESLEAYWRELGVGRDDGCTICGRKINLDLSEVRWKCQGCGRSVCREHTLTLPDAKNLEPHYGGREYFEQTLCSITCWERVGRPEE